MTATAEAPIQIPTRATSQIRVGRALLAHASVNEALYRIERSKAQADERLGLSEDMVRASLKEDWEQLIQEANGTDHDVRNAWHPDFSVPIGMARPVIEDGQRKLKNVYVASEAQGRGVGRALFLDGVNWHEGENFMFTVSESNAEVLPFYFKMGCELNPDADLSHKIGNVTVRQFELWYPGQ